MLLAQSIIELEQECLGDCPGLIATQTAGRAIARQPIITIDSSHKQVIDRSPMPAELRCSGLFLSCKMVGWLVVFYAAGLVPGGAPEQRRSPQRIRPKLAVQSRHGQRLDPWPPHGCEVVARPFLRAWDLSRDHASTSPPRSLWSVTSPAAGNPPWPDSRPSPKGTRRCVPSWPQGKGGSGLACAVAFSTRQPPAIRSDRSGGRCATALPLLGL